MKKKLVVYTDPMWAIDEQGKLNPDLASIEREVFGNDYELRFGVHDNGSFCQKGEKFLANCEGASAVVIYRSQVTPEFVERLSPTLKVVGRQGVGYDNLGIHHLEKAGIFGFNVPDYCVDEVTTHTLSLLLALERQLCLQNDRLKAGKFNIFEGGYPRRLNQLTVGIVGVGRIGRATARKLQPFYQKVIGYDPYVHADLMSGYGIEKKNTLDEFLSQSDVVIFHCLLTEETKGMGNYEFFQKMKRDALVVNTSRGQVIVSEDIYRALEEGKIGGYASDVFSPEDPNEDKWNKKMLSMENVVVTSHRAFLSRQSEDSQRRRVAEEIRYVLETGKAPRWGHQTLKLEFK